MKKQPDPDVVFPVPNFDTVIHIKPTINKSNIIVGDFSYFSGKNFENQVTHNFGFHDDKLIIGKFCQIAERVEFIMNSANHKMDCVSTFPFFIFEGWEQEIPAIKSKGDIVVGNDVWIGQNATVLPGVKIGDGAIIGANSVVGSDVEPYTVVVGNPSRMIRKRFDDELINLMLRFKWWDLPISEINDLIPLLNDNNLDKVKAELNRILSK